MNTTSKLTKPKGGVGAAAAPQPKQPICTPQHASQTNQVPKSTCSKLSAPPSTAGKSMRALGKENEELQQQIRELSETMRVFNENKHSLKSAHEVLSLEFVGIRLLLGVNGSRQVSSEF